MPETLAQAGYNSRMAYRLADLLALLDLEPIEKNIFRGQSRDIGTPQVFGGQVLGQALAAASRTVDGRAVHSLHAYFLKRGDAQAVAKFFEQARERRDQWARRARSGSPE